MKTIFILLFVVSSSYSQIINFPDANFKARLLQASTTQYGIAGSGWTGTAYTSYIKIDSNNDGEIQQSEALAVTYLNVSVQNISDLTGLEYFTNIRALKVANNTISTLYFPSLVNLWSIICSNNQLTTLDFSIYPNLNYITCDFNQITALNVSMLPNLKKVYCSHNLISNLDFSNNPQFEELGCEYNPNLTTIKIKNNHTQLFGTQTVYNQCWGGNPNLNYICADSFEIAGLQSFLASCNMTQAITIDSACVLGVEGFNANEIGVFPNPVQSQLYIDNKEAMQYELYNILGKKIQSGSLAVPGQVDCSSFPLGMYLIKLQNQKGEIKVVKVNRL